MLQDTLWTRTAWDLWLYLLPFYHHSRRPKVSQFVWKKVFFFSKRKSHLKPNNKYCVIFTSQPAESISFLFQLSDCGRGLWETVINKEWLFNYSHNEDCLIKICMIFWSRNANEDAIYARSAVPIVSAWMAASAQFNTGKIIFTGHLME